ncbi:hypothetical protein CVS40_12615 [Lucilia cuprina]|nr:hypothetical protein CVS40_12615 [Lucilia cuprina]
MWCQMIDVKNVLLLTPSPDYCCCMTTFMRKTALAAVFNCSITNLLIDYENVLELAGSDHRRLLKPLSGSVEE